MANKMFFGLGVLIIIIISAAGFVFYQQYAEIQKLKKDVADVKKLLEEHNWHEGPVTENLTPQEIDELNHILETYGLDSEKLTRRQWLYLSKVGVSWDILKPEQQKEANRLFYAEHGLNPPPEGYEYKFKTLGIPYLDESGNAIIRKIGGPNTTISFEGYLWDDSK